MTNHNKSSRSRVFHLFTDYTHHFFMSSAHINKNSFIITLFNFLCIIYLFHLLIIIFTCNFLRFHRVLKRRHPSVLFCADNKSTMSTDRLLCRSR